MNSDSDSNTSSASSPAESVTSEASGPTELPDLQRLIQHLVASKRSLTSTEHVFRANELVTNSRTLLEEIAVLNARNSFTRRGVEQQVDTLHTIKDRVVVSGDEAGGEFAQTIAKLDKANDRLQMTLASLRKTVVVASLQRVPPNDKQEDTETVEEGTAESEAQTLHDFVDDDKHSELQNDLRNLIDSFNDSRVDMNETVSKFEDSLKSMTEMLSDRPSGLEDKATIYDEPPPTISQLFHGIEGHATDMAFLLQSLISHYDLCVTALKHTEGGGEAARQAIQQATEKPAKVEQSLYLKKVAEPLSDAERNEMLRTLEHDAAQVEGAVEDIHDHNRGQENQYEALSRHAKHARSMDNTLREVLEMLHEMEDIHLPAHLYALQTFQSSWRTVQASIATKTDELILLGAHHEGFLNAYSQLLREVDRRKAADRQVQKVAEKARKDIQKLCQADREARHDFMDEYGIYLPRDLWAGSEDPGLRWEIKAVAVED